MIQVKNLHKTYNKGKTGEQHVLKDVSLELPETGLVCILGESGSGKTTLLNAVGGLDDFEGSVFINDTEITGYQPEKIEPIRNEHFGYIFQNYYLLQDFTVAYNVKIALNRYELTDEEKDVRVDYVLDMLGMLKFKKKLVSRLSGGQQQRVSIARALVKAPDVILADEPTGNLDEENTLRTMSILKNISKTTLVLLVTHEKRIARFFADRIIEVRDGRIYRDEANHSSDSFDRVDDANIYLREMDCSRLQSNYADFSLYCEKEDEPRQIKLGLAWRDGKLYIQNRMNCDVLLEGEANGVQMLDEERPKLDMEDVEKFSYDLPQLTSDKKAKLSGKEIWRMATQNIRLMGKKQTFVAAILLVTAVLLSITVAQIVNTVSVDEESIVSTDSHYVHLNFKRVASSMWSDDEKKKIVTFYEEELKSGKYGEVVAAPAAGLYLRGSGFVQIRNLRQEIKGFVFADKKLVKEDKLLYGEMPKARDEILVDKRVINRLVKSKGTVSDMYGGAESYVGARVFAAVSGLYLTITGICDTGESDIYTSPTLMYTLAKEEQYVETLEELKSRYPGTYDDVELKDDEILVRKGLLNALNAGKKVDEKYQVGSSYQLGDDKDHIYKIAGVFEGDESLRLNHVISRKGEENVLEQILFDNRECYLYTDKPEKTAEEIKEAAKDYTMAFQLEATVPYQDQIREYREAHTIDLGARGLITLIVSIVSLVMVYFTMKSNAVSRSEELTVYRLIGISGGSIRKAYMLEMALMTCYTSLPAVLVTSGVIKFIGSIPSLQMNLIFPWWSVLLLLIGIFGIHSLISILPVSGILAKPPAALAVKE